MPVIPFVAIGVAAMVASAVTVSAVPAVPEQVHREHCDHEQEPQPVALQPFHLVTPFGKRPVKKCGPG